MNAVNQCNTGTWASCDNGGRVRERPHSLYSRPLEDLIAIFLPHVIVASFAFILLIFVYEPSISFLLYSAVSTKYKSWFTFATCMMEEVRFVMFIIGIIVPIWQLQVVAFEDISCNLKDMIDSPVMQA